MGAVARILPDGKRLHLQHGPSDLIVLAEGQRARAYDAAIARFETIIGEVVDELPLLRCALSDRSERPRGRVARRMFDAALAFAHSGYVTPMAAVAGAIADEVLEAMTEAADLHRAYVNNGGDIALHLSGEATFATAIAGHDGGRLGTLRIAAADRVRGIATSGRHGRSLSLGIADSVTVLARSAALADVGATLTANAVDLAERGGIVRRRAREVVEDSDLGDLAVVVHCPPLGPDACGMALGAGKARAAGFQERGLISGAALFLQGHVETTADPHFLSAIPEALDA